MSLTLRWTNKNTVPVKVEIYRGDAPLDKKALPATPLATLTAGEEVWVDATAVPNATYYYLFVTTRGETVVYSRNHQMAAIPRRGAGPPDLLWGDNTIGYFGTLTSAEFIDTFQILTGIGFTPSEASSFVWKTSPIWHKFIRNGKILYIPNGPLSQKVTWMMAALKGAVFGTGTKEPHAVVHDTMQDAKVKIKQQFYKVRMPLGYSDDPTAIVPAGVLGTDQDWTCEWQDLIASQVAEFSPMRRTPNVSMIAASTFFQGSGNGVAMVCAEMTSATDVLNRGTAYSGQTTVMRASSGPAIEFYGTGPWIPVLELIE